MKLKRFLCYFFATLAVNLTIVVTIGSRHGGVSSMLNTAIHNPALLLSFFVASGLVGLFALKK
jgi:putative exporter of polyketide antibiotics